MTDKAEKFTDECLAEMFKRVGEVWPNKELTAQEDWYTQRTWTEAEENSFRDWMNERMKKTFGLNEKKRQYEISMFLLNWGWSNKG